MTTKKEGSKIAAVGVGLAAAVAGAAGAYFLYGKDGAKNRKKVKGWALKAKGEVLEQLERLQDVNEETYNKVVDEVGKRYGQLKDIDNSEVLALTKELKGHWRNVKKHIAPAAKKVTKKK